MKVIRSILRRLRQGSTWGSLGTVAGAVCYFAKVPPEGCAAIAGAVAAVGAVIDDRPEPKAGP